IPVPGFSVNPDPVNFGVRPVTQNSPPAAVVVTNNGTGPLHVTSVGIFAGGGPGAFPADYRISAQTCTAKPVPPGGTCQVTVIQRPLGIGVRPSALRFEEDAHPGVPQLIPMTGAGAQPVLTAQPPLGRPGDVSQVTGVAFPPGQVV